MKFMSTKCILLHIHLEKIIPIIYISKLHDFKKYMLLENRST